MLASLTISVLIAGRNVTTRSQQPKQTESRLIHETTAPFSHCSASGSVRGAITVRGSPQACCTSKMLVRNGDKGSLYGKACSCWRWRVRLQSHPRAHLP
jgi:hypothetical protein